MVFQKSAGFCILCFWTYFINMITGFAIFVKQHLWYLYFSDKNLRFQFTFTSKNMAGDTFRLVWSNIWQGDFQNFTSIFEISIPTENSIFHRNSLTWYLHFWIFFKISPTWEFFHCTSLTLWVNTKNSNLRFRQKQKLFILTKNNVILVVNLLPTKRWFIKQFMVLGS